MLHRGIDPMRFSVVAIGQALAIEPSLSAIVARTT